MWASAGNTIHSSLIIAITARIMEDNAARCTDRYARVRRIPPGFRDPDVIRQASEIDVLKI